MGPKRTSESSLAIMSKDSAMIHLSSGSDYILLLLYILSCVVIKISVEVEW